MSKVLIIGCGGVASVAIHKCCQVPEVFTDICIASRTKSKCDKLAAELAPKTTTRITTAQVNADHVDEVIALIKSYQPDLVMNIALPYQDLTIMDACLACGVNYMDTANYEPENTDDPAWRAVYEKRCKEAGFSAYFDYSWQWAYAKKFEEAGLTALLGSGFDPGVTQAYCAYAKKHEFDTIDTIDILDCNGGDHGYAFATNFNPEINLREVSAPGSYWEDGHWVEIPAMSIKREYDFDKVGQKDMYLLHHEEIESLAKNIPEAKRIRFFMTFGQSYLDHMRCLEDVGMLSTTPIQFNGQEIVPIQFLKALLPDPASLGPRTKGKTNIGCIFTGKKDGKEKTYYIYNVCDHQECYKEVGSQAISYTTGVPAMCGALMLLTGKWTTKGVHTVEEFDPDPYLDALDKYGLPRSESHTPLWWTDAGARYTPALRRAGKPLRSGPRFSAHPLLPAGRGPAAPQRRNFTGRPAADGLQDAAGPEGLLQLRPLPPPRALSGGHGGQRPLREPSGQGGAAPEGEPRLLRRLPGGRVRRAAPLRRPRRLQLPRPAGKVRPGGKGCGQERGPAHQPRVLDAGGPRHL